MSFSNLGRAAPTVTTTAAALHDLESKPFLPQLPSLPEEIQAQPGDGAQEPVQRQVPANPAQEQPAQLQAPVDPAPQPQVEESFGRAEPVAAVRHVLEGKTWADLEALNLKKLRRLVINHLGLGSRDRHALAQGRRHEFQDVAAEVIQELKKTLAPDVEDKPGWYQVLEDEDAVTAIYLITLAGILPDTAANVSVPLKVLEGFSREQIRDADAS